MTSHGGITGDGTFGANYLSTDMESKKRGKSIERNWQEN